MLNCSIVWDGKPVRQAFGRCLVVFDGVVSVRVDHGGIIRDFRVNVTATTGGRKPEASLRYMSEAKRGHEVPANALPDVRAYVIAQAALHLVEYRAAYVAEVQARDAALMAERQPLKLSGNAAPAEVAAVMLSPVETIDMTPTWAGILPALLAAVTDGTQEGQRIARLELARMAQIADSYVAAQKALKGESN